MIRILFLGFFNFLEGSEWTPLERLLKDEKEIKKIRTLDMEVHVGYGQDFFDAEQTRGQKAMEREVEILEKLRNHFHLIGSTLESYLMILYEFFIHFHI